MNRLLICCCLAWCRCLVGVAGEGVDYLRDVKPILKARCYKCHGPENQESDLRLDAVAMAIAGGISGPAIIAGKSDESLIVKALLGKSDDVMRMPPEDEGDRLADDQISLIRHWIDQGAPHPTDEVVADRVRTNSTHWSFQPIQRPLLPDGHHTHRVHNAIDRFVLAELARHGIQPSPAADRVTLIRRLSLDLVGLPPSLGEVERFVDDRRPDAYDRLVDRFLASPRHGERWGRHWLDQARYADSDGYTNDPARVIWKYRDWVIDAVNRDLPFDEFTIKQIAGDLIPDATQEDIIATGFHRNTQHNREGGSDAEQYRVESVVERVSTTGVVFLGLTLGCARCHDHKFDPVSQREFYELFAFLNNQDEPVLTVPLAGPEYEAWEQLQTAVAALEHQLRQYDAESAARQAAWEQEVATSSVFGKEDAITAILEIAPHQRTKEQREKLTNEFHRRDPSRVELADRLANLREREKTLAAKATTSTLVMREREQPRTTFVHIRGDFLRKGKRVAPRVPAVLPPLALRAASPTRIDLARWLVTPENPLTPRVTVNRIWQQFFGKGIVETENDFGIQGSPPTHPELLDWLAAEFIEHRWHRKQLHRLIVTSGTYRQSSHARADLVDVDPGNLWLARQNRLRLEAEAIRDTTLDVAGLLSDKMYGPSVYPPQPDGLMKMTKSNNRKWKVSPGEDRYRRGMYTFFWRSTPHPFLNVFDAPETNTTCTRRDRSNTPLQSLTLLNDEAFIEAAEALAVRVLNEVHSLDSEQQIAYIFRLCLARGPNGAEKAAVRELLEREIAGPLEGGGRRFVAQERIPAGVDHRQLAAWTTVARALLNVDEFITRE